MFKEYFINGLIDDGMRVSIICKLTSISDTSSIMNKQVLAWLRGVEAQRIENASLDTTKENKGFDAVGFHKPIVKPI